MATQNKLAAERRDAVVWLIVNSVRGEVYIERQIHRIVIERQTPEITFMDVVWYYSWADEE